jgi:hypothetical protein
VHDAADNAPIIHPLLAADIRGEMRFDPAPLPVCQLKQLAAHNSQPPSSRKNHYRIVKAKELMSSNPKDPSFTLEAAFDAPLMHFGLCPDEWFGI